LDVRLVEITQLRREGMPNILIGNDDLSRDLVTAIKCELVAVHRRDEFFRTCTLRFAADRKNVYTQRVILKKFVDRIELIRPFIKSRNGCICRGPTMRD